MRKSDYDWTKETPRLLVRDTLEHPERKSWTLQGFGMLRCHLPCEGRLNIWDERYTYKPRPSMIHDHPWDFDSLVVCGALINQTYIVEPGPADWVCRTIRPGIGTQEIKEEPVYLRRDRAVCLREGASYYQRFDEIHESDPVDGHAVTLNIRNRGDRPDVARVFYPRGEQWYTAEPRVATHDEIQSICDFALERWFK
jgi:hypothetical protein